MMDGMSGSALRNRLGGIATAILGAVLLLALGGCGGGQSVLASQPEWGFNLLQSRQVAYDAPDTRVSLERLMAIGAEHVAVVAFLEQADPYADSPRRGDQVTDEQLVAALRTARDLGFKTLLKPQLLVGDFWWAGEVDPPSSAEWFRVYREHLVHYALIAEQEGVESLVIGTEMDSLAGDVQEWERLIADVRQVFGGKLTYAAHDVSGIPAFGAWGSLDAVGVTLYPSYGENADREAVRSRIQGVLDDLGGATAGLPLPVWVLEIGHPSAVGGLARPWDWRRLEDPAVTPAPEEQAMVLDEWIRALRGRVSISSVSVWAWYSDPEAGGLEDNGYTVQNKPAESILCNWWKDGCSG